MKSGHSEPLAGIVDSGKSTAIGIADTTEHNHVEAERESIQSKSIGVHVCWRTCGSAPGKMRRRASMGSNSGRKLRPPMLAVTPEAGCRCRWSWPSDTTTNLSKCRAHCLVMDTSSHNLHRYCQCTPSVYFKKQQRKHNRLIETVNEMHTLESTCWHVDRPWSSFAMHSIHETLCLHCSLLRYGCITVVQKTTHDQ